jgi:FAD/FMN-containing dehydrogenase
LQQGFIVPACVIRPSTTEEVSLALKTITKHECHFAVKSGGHAMFPGASNADGGITLDLRDINGIELFFAVEDNDMTRDTTVRLGTGLRWGQVYEFLEQFGVTVVGGRDSGVGVGGFLLGGGISFLSRQYGWASDNVKNYDVS